MGVDNFSCLYILFDDKRKTEEKKRSKREKGDTIKFGMRENERKLR